MFMKYFTKQLLDLDKLIFGKMIWEGYVLVSAGTNGLSDFDPLRPRNADVTKNKL